MKMLVIRTVLLAATAITPLFSAGAAYAQRSHETPGYSAVDHSRGSNYRSSDDQRTIDEITGNDWSAGK